MRCKTCNKVKSFNGPKMFAPLPEDYCDCSKVRKVLEKENDELKSKFDSLDEKIEDLETELEISNSLNQDWIAENHRVKELEKIMKERGWNE